MTYIRLKIYINEVFQKKSYIMIINKIEGEIKDTYNKFKI